MIFQVPLQPLTFCDTVIPHLICASWEGVVGEWEWRSEAEPKKSGWEESLSILSLILTIQIYFIWQ